MQDQFSQFSRSVVSDSLQPHGLQHTRPPCSSPTPGTYSNSPSIQSVMPSNHLIFCHPLLLLPSIFLSIRVFSNESVLHIRWPKYWSLCFSISPSNEYSRLISFRRDWLDLLAVQGTLKSILQYHSSKAYIAEQRNQSEKATYYMITIYIAFWKRHNYGGSKRLVAVPG